MNENLLEISLEIFRIIIPIIMFIAIVGNTINIFILKQRIFRLKSFSFYLLLFSMNNFIYSTLILSYRLLSIGYQISPNLSSNTACRIFQYLNDLCPSVSPYFIVLASFDRYCYSSFNQRLKKFNEIKLAKYLSLFLIILFILFYLETAYLVQLNFDDGLGCRIRTNALYNQIYVILQFLFLIIFAPFLMILFSLMTFYNIKKFRIIRINEIEQRRIEMQLIRIIFNEIIVHIVLLCPMGITYLMILLPTKYSRMKSFYGVYTICYFPFYLSYGTSFFILLFFDRCYRREFVRLFRRLIPFVDHS